MLIKDKLIDLFSSWVNNRHEKGIETYGTTLDDAEDSDYDWDQMLIEELLDGLQYQQKEIKRLKELLKASDVTIDRLTTNERVWREQYSKVSAERSELFKTIEALQGQIDALVKDHKEEILKYQKLLALKRGTPETIKILDDHKIPYFDADDQ